MGFLSAGYFVLWYLFLEDPGTITGSPHCRGYVFMAISLSKLVSIKFCPVHSIKASNTHKKLADDATKVIHVMAVRHWRDAYRTS